MILGAVLVLAALSLFLWNRWEDGRAGASVDEILTQIEAAVEEGKTDPDSTSDDMTERMIDGYSYIGVLTIPSLGLELPVMSDWSYPQLRIAPCRYSGSVATGDLVIAAHNYSRHFGSIKNLTAGDKVYFADLNGAVTAYEVVEVDILNPTAIEEMTDSGFDLTLFTCTYGGKSRVTVRCNTAP